MSWVLCDICECPINTDDDPEAWDYDGETGWFCEAHRPEPKDTLLASSEEKVWV